MGEKLTKADVAKIQEEIDHRKLDLRPELIEAVKEARAQGDLSENFEYYAAKREKNRNESRIGYLERMLKYATVIDDSSREDEVGLNKVVEVLFVEDDEINYNWYIDTEEPIDLADEHFFRINNTALNNIQKRSVRLIPIEWFI